MKRSMIFAAALVAGVCASGLASAAVFSGQVAGDHLNPGVAGRGACTQLVGAVVPGSPWFCNYVSGNPLYNQINSLLEQTAINGTSCTISTVATDSGGLHKIQWIECPPI